ncbi:MAG: TlpA disulfide reductase family protein [Bacteroidota bacterium]|nr:TlpA disulfide reductase family protein [Bacteroidota bacterium]
MKFLAIAAVAVLLIGCEKKETKEPSVETTAQYKENVSILLLTEKNNGEQSPPNFFWYDQNGKKISFAEFSKGKPVLVNFWATWCGPCIHETPDLVALNEEYAPKGALIIGISADRDDDALNLVSAFTKEKNVIYPIVIDNGDLEEAFGGLRGYPTTFYIDKNGKIVKKMIGAQSKETFAKEFDAIL